MPELRIISLGAGVQSTTMALMAAHGEIGPKPDCAIFADTQWEPKAVYEHLKWLMSPNVLPFPVHVVTGGDLRQATLDRSNTTGGAIEVDKAIRHQPRFRGSQFMHRSLKPLSEVDLSTAEDHGQLNLFNNECEGMCGV